MAARGGLGAARPRVRGRRTPAVDVTPELPAVIGVGVITLDAEMVPAPLTQMPPRRDTRVPETVVDMGRSRTRPRASLVAASPGLVAPIPARATRHLVDAQDEVSLVAPVRFSGRCAPGTGEQFPLLAPVVPRRLGSVARRVTRQNKGLPDRKA